MSEFDDTFDFAGLDDDGLDIASIFGEPSAAPPPPAPTPVSEPKEAEPANPEPASAAVQEDGQGKTNEQGSAAEGETEPEADGELDLLAALAPENETAPKPAAPAQAATVLKRFCGEYVTL